MIFFKVVFSKFCKKSRSSHHRCSIKKAVLKQLFKNTYFEKHLPTTASVNSRADVFQESLALAFKRNVLTSGIRDSGELV